MSECKIRAVLSRLVIFGLAACAVMRPLPAAAQQSPQDALTPSGWTFSLTPYLWMSGVSGTLDTKRGGNASFDQSFTDILDKLHGMPFMGIAEARYDRFSIVGDIIYLPVGVALHSQDGTFAVGSVNINTTIGTTAAYYRILESGANSIDIGGGVRAYGVSNSVWISDRRGRRDSFSTWDAWADPLISLRAHADFANSLGVSFYGDVGGFGVGSASQLSWQLIGSLDYQLTPAVVLRAGYRYLAINLDGQHGTTFDMRIGGPFLAATFKF